MFVRQIKHSERQGSERGTLCTSRMMDMFMRDACTLAKHLVFRTASEI